MAKALTPGDVCELRSGSPPMTIFGVRGDGLLEVAWHENGEFHYSGFDRESLRALTWWDRLCIAFGSH